MVPANELVHLVAAEKERGQHTEIAFESVNLSIAQLDDKGYFCTNGRLAQVVTRAIRQARGDEVTMRVLEDLLASITQLNLEYRQKILRLTP